MCANFEVCSHLRRGAHNFPTQQLKKHTREMLQPLCKVPNWVSAHCSWEAHQQSRRDAWARRDARCVVWHCFARKGLLINHRHRHFHGPLWWNVTHIWRASVELFHHQSMFAPFGITWQRQCREKMLPHSLRLRKERCRGCREHRSSQTKCSHGNISTHTRPCSTYKCLRWKSVLGASEMTAERKRSKLSFVYVNLNGCEENSAKTTSLPYGTCYK